MTPSLLQKIELLTLSRMELSELLNQELAENPVLEEAADQDLEAPAERPAAETEKAEGSEQSTETYEDFDYEYFFGEYLTPSAGGQREHESGDEDRPSFDLFLANPSTLADHLTWQLNLSEVRPDIKEVAVFIIGNLNEEGYLVTPVEEIIANLGSAAGPRWTKR